MIVLQKAEAIGSEDTRSGPSRLRYVLNGKEPGTWWWVWAVGKGGARYFVGAVGGSEQAAAKTARSRWPQFSGKMELEEIVKSSSRKRWTALTDSEKRNYTVWDERARLLKTTARKTSLRSRLLLKP